MSASDGQLYPFGYGDEEIRRFGMQHRVWQEENRRLLNRAGFAQGNTLVDLGRGPGLTTLDLARRVGPTGRIFPVDRDGERTIPRLREAADAAGLGNVETRVADLEQFVRSPLGERRRCVWSVGTYVPARAGGQGACNSNCEVAPARRRLCSGRVLQLPAHLYQSAH